MAEQGSPESEGPAGVKGEPSPQPKIHVDADWKKQAQAEKERLAREVEEKGPSARKTGEGGPAPLPPATGW